MLKRNPTDALQTRDPAFIKRISGILHKTLWPYHRAEVRGLERIPEHGGLIYVGNHNGYPYMAEGWLFTSAVYEALGMSRVPYFLMHEVSLGLPLINQLFTRYGALGATSRNAIRIMQGGHPMLVYPGAEEELMRPYRDRAKIRFQGRTSHVRLALRYDVPIVPVASVGGHSTAIIIDDLPWLAERLGVKRRFKIGAWPLMVSIPWGLTLGPIIPPYIPWPSKIIVEALDPIRFERTGPAAARDPGWVRECSDRVERALSDALVRLEDERVSQHGLLRFALRKAAEGLDHLLAVEKAAERPALASFHEHVDIRGLFPERSQPKKDKDKDKDSEKDKKANRKRRKKKTRKKEKQQAKEKLRAKKKGRAITRRRGTARTHARTSRSEYPEAMKRRVLAEVRAGETVSEVCRVHGIATSTYYRWRRAAEGPRRTLSSATRRQHSRAEIRRALAKARAGTRVVDVCREFGISTSTFYRWRARE